ncbi:alpha/beta fold hydrolase [uncultured Limnobacter sp.]|uniref:alpha/beta hydrolase family protein n=1 Tax=uncultured Limnobacter sp. TaxID=199681 RepID=UPI0030FB15F0
MRSRLKLMCLALLPLLAWACNGENSADSATRNTVQSSEAFGWPMSVQGENPPESPVPSDDVLFQLGMVSDMLPRQQLVGVVDPIALGYTLSDITDPALLEFQIRAMAAQLSDGSRIDQVFHWYGHPENNKSVALVPVEFQNRYGTRLHGEIVLPKRGQTQATAQKYPVILALEGLNTNTAMYRWWHQLFADAGYLVFAFDFSGQGRSDDEVQGDPGNNIEEAQDALSYLLNNSPVREFIDSARIGVIGHSMGAIATMGLQAVEPRLKAAVAAAPISEIQSVFNSNPIPVMIQTGDHDGPIAPIVAVNPAVVRPVYDKLTSDRAFIVADAASHAQHTNYPLLPTSTWGREIAAQYSLAWVNYHLRGDSEALKVLQTAHPRLSYLWESEVVIGQDKRVFKSAGPAPLQ